MLNRLQMDNLIALSEQFVKKALSSNDASHDFHHIDRVRRMAVALGREEGLREEDIQVVELASLLHDVGDWKYQKQAVDEKQTVLVRQAK